MSPKHALSRRDEGILLETFQLLQRTCFLRSNITHIYLSHFRSFIASRIRYIERECNRLVLLVYFRQLQIRILERSIRQTVSKRIKRLNLFPVISTITHEYSFIIIHLPFFTCLIIIATSRRIFPSLFYGKGNLAEGTTFPDSISANARPPACPGYSKCTTAFTRSIHGLILTPPPACRLTIRFGFTSAS